MNLDLSKLDSTLERYQELVEALADPAVIQDQERYIKVSQEFSDLEPIVKAINHLKDLAKTIEESKELITESDDQEFKELARAELNEAEENYEKEERNLEKLLVPKDPNDEKNVILEIRPGAGGEEAALFASELLQMYRYYATNQGWNHDLINFNGTELGGVKEAVLEIKGKNAYSYLKFESGVHRVQRVPETEAGGRIHTSTVTVAVLPEVDDVEVDIDPKDIQIDVYRSSGAGGQHVNKTSSAIRITHFPTGIVVTCQDERSQYKNKDRAFKILRSRLYALKKQEQDSEIAGARHSQIGSGDRSERIRTYNFPQSRVTDHRVNLTSYQLDSVLAGDLDEFITTLQAKAHEDAVEASAMAHGEGEDETASPAGK